MIRVISDEGRITVGKLYTQLFSQMLYPAYETGLRRRKTLAYLREYERSQWLSQDEILAMQWQKLSALIAHCWDNVPYYRRKWAQAGLASAQDIRSLQDYAALPRITKAEIREHPDELQAPQFNGRMLYKTTGGSTGEPLLLGYTRESYERRCAVMHRGYAWAGAPLGTRTLYLWGEDVHGVPLKTRMMNLAFNRKVLNVFRFQEAQYPQYADELDRFRPDAIVGYARPMADFARWLVESGRKVHAPKAVLSAAERLLPEHRQWLEQAFGCPAFDTYGCRETMLIASECEHRDGLHVNADHLCVQLGQPLEGGGSDAPKEILLTDLHNWGMPLMRYAVGDLAREKPGVCACGRGLPMMSAVEGRVMDVLRTSEGHIIADYLEHLVHDAGGIIGFQAVQNHIDSIDLSVVPGKGFGEDSLTYLHQGMREAYGEIIRLNIHVVDDLQLTPTGKLRITVSNL